MLSAQRKEFDEKKKDESPYPRDFERWYALDYFRRPRALKTKRFWITLITTVVVAALCGATFMPALHSAHQAMPVSKGHALIGQNCAACHDQAFSPVARLFGVDVASVSDQRCSSCHQTKLHHANQSHDAACATCHREHSGHDRLAAHVGDQNCAACHADLPIHVVGGKTNFDHAISHFNRDHPEFAPSAMGKKDQARIQFNHKAHLDLELDDLRRAHERAGRDDLKGLDAKMKCADCHQMDDERKYMKPINYENHCSRCHALNVTLAGDFAKVLAPALTAFAKMPLPHKEPAIVRAVLRDRLVEFAQQTKIVASKGVPSVPRPLPWRPVSEEQWSWASGQAKQAEAILFMNKQWQKNEPLTGCAHCHIEKEHSGGLPVYHQTQIPERWYPHSIFNHGSHRSMNCMDCHDRNPEGVKVAESRTTADILLPSLQSCKECHKGAGAARNACVECHRYHQR